MGEVIRRNHTPQDGALSRTLRLLSNDTIIALQLKHTHLSYFTLTLTTPLSDRKDNPHHFTTTDDHNYKKMEQKLKIENFKISNWFW